MVPIPSEVYEHILSQLPPSRNSDTSVLTLARCSQSSSRLRALSNLPFIWAPHYHVRWTRQNPSQALYRRSKMGDDWRMLYAERRRLDRRALVLLDGILQSRDGRHDRANELVLELGYDIWDVLDLQTAGFNDPTGDSLARAYWAEQAMGAISRHSALNRWNLLKRGEDIGFVESVASFSAFWGTDLQEINAILDDLTRRCRQYLSQKNVTISPHEISYNMTELATQICTWMRSEGFDKADASQYHDLPNHFPNKVLTTHRRTLPLSLVWLFVALARKLGLQASPIGFPAQVMAHVYSPTSQETIYVDVFDSANEPIKSLNDLTSLLASMGLPPSDYDRCTQPCPTIDITHRVTGNIMHSVSTELDRESLQSRLAINVSLYAAFTWMAIISPPRATEITASLIAAAEFACPLDFGPVILNTLASVLQGSGDVMKVVCKQYMAKQSALPGVMSRRNRVEYFVGMLFRYEDRIAVVTGWHHKCVADNPWIAMHNVDQLPRGRKQPFYMAYDTAGIPIYCAEEVVEPMADCSIDVFKLLWKNNPLLGPLFNRVHLDKGRCRFVISSLHAARFPEDEKAAEEYYQ